MNNDQMEYACVIGVIRDRLIFGLVGQVVVNNGAKWRRDFDKLNLIHLYPFHLSCSNPVRDHSLYITE